MDDYYDLYYYPLRWSDVFAFAGRLTLIAPLLLGATLLIGWSVFMDWFFQ